MSKSSPPFCFLLCLLLPMFAGAVCRGLPTASSRPASTAPRPHGSHDTLTFENGDTLSGTLEHAAGNEVSFKSDELGEIKVKWKKIRSLHTEKGFVVLENTPGVRIRHFKADAYHGVLAIQNEKITVTPNRANSAGESPAEAGSRSVMPIPVSDAQYILSQKAFERQVLRNPPLYAGWNGSFTAGLTLVKGTQNQYSYSTEVALERTVPTVEWLQERRRTQADFSSSYGKITQPGYENNGTYVPSSFSKTSILHADAEQDQYIATRVYALVQTVFDHNYSQGLDLQQIYGAGFGVTAVKRKIQQLDFKATLQYEKQLFITPASGTNQNLVGSTISAGYVLKVPKSIIFNQQVSYIPAFNQPHAYSANETSTLTFPLYKKLAFTVGTIDSYLNDPVPAVPPTTRNSFQLTSGITYTLKSNY